MWRVISGKPNRPKANYTYKLVAPLATRIDQANKILQASNNKCVPVYIEGENVTDSEAANKLNAAKFNISREITIYQFLQIIRRKMIIPPTKGLYLFVNNSEIIPTHKTIGQIYDKFVSDDKHLYITYAFEETFG